MPNQVNFRNDISNITDPRFIASRIVKFPEEGILQETIPASFAYDAYDNIEIHFYTVPGNELVVSDVVSISETEILKTHVVTYDDGTLKNYIRIDFTKLFETRNQIIIPGDYKVALNFFSDEIGSYYDRNLFVQLISDSKTEVQLAFSTNTSDVAIAENKHDLYEFTTKSFDKSNAVGVAYKIFASGVELNDDSEGLTYDNILQNIELSDIQQTYANTIARIKRLSETSESAFENQIKSFLNDVYETLRELIIINGDRRIQESEFRDFIDKAVSIKFQELQASVDRRIILT